MLLRWEQVSVFGEMVGLLAGAGNLDGAATLERIWDATQRQLSFPLICSYKVDQFDGCAAVALAEDLCALHSRVVPSESYMSLPDDDARLRTVALLQLKGHRLDQKSRHGDPPIRPHDDDACVITRREHDIVQLVAEGLSNSMIADRLVLSKGTVANHIQHIFRKLELRSRTQIALWAVRHGFNDADDGCAGWAFPPSIQAHADSSEMQLRR
jgi:DNA-binding NarL/FixJ family response regulator